ncbi:MAG: O-methyltransferase [Candidatus Zixiibacteriota bacterium]
MHITDPKINEYIKKSMAPIDPVLVEMDNYARENNFPIIGPMCGILLRQLAIATKAKNIFEMGSGYGYSAYWFAGGIPEDGKIICTEGSEDNKNLAMEYLKRGGFDHKVEFHVGYAQDIIKKYDGPFDIIFNDVDKEQYPEAFDLAIPKLKKSGLFITDNVLWSGRIFDDDPVESTRGVLEFNKKLFAANNLLSSIVPIRDGFGIAVKL